MAWSSPAFFSARTVLMGAHNSAVDHRVFVVGIGGEMCKDPPPYTVLGPAAEPLMHVLPIPEALRQVAPRNAGAIVIEHCFDEQPVVRRGHAHMALLPRQQVSDALPLIIAKGVASHRSAPKGLTPYESSFAPRRNPLNGVL